VGENYPVRRPVRLPYQPPASSTFLLEQTSHQQPASSTFLSEKSAPAISQTNMLRGKNARNLKSFFWWLYANKKNQFPGGQVTFFLCVAVVRGKSLNLTIKNPNGA
jgi:hypothetical protein